MTATDRLRALRPEDLERVIEIDRRIRGRSRRGFFETRLNAALDGPDTFIVMAAEDEGTLTGYAIARVQRGEFGGARAVAVLDSIGVDPESQDSGLGTLLMDGVAGAMKKLGIGEIRTQVDWSDQDLIRFFAASGFSPEPRMILECPPTGRRTPPPEERNMPDTDIASQPFDAGMPDYSDPSGDDWVALSRDKFPVRSMREEDLDAIVRIDGKLSGRERRDYFQRQLDEVMHQSGVRLSLVAEVDGAPAGFVMARVDFGEFGRPEPAAVIDTIGVDPAHAHTGIGHALISQLMINLANLRVETVLTELDWDDFGLLEFLGKIGFTPSRRLVLSRRVD